MCGLTGIFSTRESAGTVEAMMTCLSHRGPDDTGIEELTTKSGERAATFGHRRLAILDLSPGGHQPKFSADRRFCMTYNGEIYNYAELKKDLESAGMTFSTASDSEVILRGWEKEGPGYLRRLRGMFALVIWDRQEETGYLIRDPFGIKPLYVAEVDGDILFASEIRAILDTGRVARRLSPEAVRSYLSTGSVSEPLTIIDGIRAIPPGFVNRVVKAGSGFRIEQGPAYIEPFSSDGVIERHRRSHIHRIRDALRESVRYHLVSDVPVGVFLSGGIDSSAVAGLASEVSSTPIDSFTVTFAESDYSEAEPAREAARRFGTRHHEVPLSGRDLLDMLPDVFSAMDQPSLDGFNTFVVSRAVAEHGLKVVLSGLGGDELFGGYPSFRRAQMISPLWRLPRALRKAGSIALSPLSDIRASRVRALLDEDVPARAAYRASRTLFGERQVKRLMDSGPGPEAIVSPWHPGSFDLDGLNIMQQVSALELMGYMRNTLLRDSDVFSMAWGLELRVPLVDIRVAQVAREAAAAATFNGEPKPMLLEAVRDLVPESSFSKPKKGFTLPFEKWMRVELYREVDSVLTGGGARSLGLVPDEVATVWSLFQSRRPGVNWSRPWALYTLLKWARENGVSVDGAEETPESLAGLPIKQPLTWAG
jgi:asparagine synthase (glutamine-hydrolysing)